MNEKLHDFFDFLESDDQSAKANSASSFVSTPVSRAFWRVMLLRDRYKEIDSALPHDHINKDRYQKLIIKSNELMARFDKQLAFVAKAEKPARKAIAPPVEDLPAVEETSAPANLKSGRPIGTKSFNAAKDKIISIGIAKKITGAELRREIVRLCDTYSNGFCWLDNETERSDGKEVEKRVSYGGCSISVNSIQKTAWSNEIKEKIKMS